jgi:hypothetical protein
MIIQTTLVVLMVIGFGGVVLGIIGWLSETIRNKSISNLKVEDLTIPKSKFVQLVNDWCWENLKSNNPKPTVTISYNKNKTVSGVYYPFNNSIVVYINNQTHLINIVDVTIHEFTHSTQKTKGFDKLYNQYTQEKGYWNNPFEQECEKVSEKNKHQCLQDLITNNNILK